LTLKMNAITHFHFRINYSIRLRKSFSVLVLAAILYFGIIPTTLADFLPAQPRGTEITQKKLIAQGAEEVLPSRIADAIRQRLSRSTNLPKDQFKVIEANRKIWTDGCLGLPGPGELCTQAMVQGWRVVMSQGKKTWVYRTDGDGRNVRPETKTTIVQPSR
jgi:hypothetical protein